MGAVLQLLKPDAMARPTSSAPAFRPQGKTLTELAAWFLHEFASPLAPATRTNYERTLKLATEGSPGHGKFGVVRALPDHPTPAEVTRWLSDMKLAGYNDSTINLRRTDLVHVYEAGSRCTVSYGNPAIVLPWRKVVPKRAPLKDVTSTWAFLRAALSRRELAFVAVLRFTGVRKGEALGLEWQHIDFTRGVVRIDQQRRKANSRETTRRLKSEAARRWVPMRAELRDVLLDLREAEGDTVEVKTGLGGGLRATTGLMFPWGEYQLGKILAVLRGIDPSGFPEADAWHVFRHTVACELWRAGKSEAFIQEWLGHSSLEKTATYLRSLDGRRISIEDVAALDPDYRPKKRRPKDESPARVQARARLPSVTGAETPAAVVPPVAPVKEAPMKTTTVEATSPAVTTTPAVAERSAKTFAEVRKLGAQAHEGSRRAKKNESGHVVSLSSAGSSSAEESEANGGVRRGSKAKKAKVTTTADEEAVRAALVETKLRAIVLFSDEMTEQARALSAVAPERAEELLSVIGGLRDVAEGREVSEPTARAVQLEKAALVRALQNMTQAHRCATEAVEALVKRCESLRFTVDELEAQRDRVRAVLMPSPAQTMEARAAEVVETHRRAGKLLRAYEEKDAAQVKAIDDLCSAQPPASEGFDPGIYEGTGKGVA